MNIDDWRAFTSILNMLNLNRLIHWWGGGQVPKKIVKIGLKIGDRRALI